MKKKLLVSLSVALMVASFPVSTYAYTENRISKFLNVQKNTKFTTSMAPVLVIEASNDHTADFTFELNLENGEWQDTSEFSMPSGISLLKITSTSIVVTVDVSVFNATTTDIRIPMLVEKVDGAVSVTIDPLNSTVSGGTFAVAQAGAAKTTIEILDTPEIGRFGTMGSIKITDNSIESVSPTDKIKLQLSNSFVFKGTGEISGTGKYAGNVQFTIDSEDPSIGYISVKSSTSNNVGTISLSAVRIQADSDSTYGDIALKVTKDGQSVTLDTAAYENLYKDIVIDNIDTSKSEHTFTGTAHPEKYLEISIDGAVLGKVKTDAFGNWSYTTKNEVASGSHTVKVQYYDDSLKALFESISQKYSTEYTDDTIVFTIGANRYELNGRKTEIDAPAYIDQNGRTMLPVRAFSNALGIADDSIEWDSGDRVVTITRADSTTVRIPVNSSTIYIAGSAQIIDTYSVIKDDRIFLPLRAVANALGISDDNIKWDAENQTVTIYK